MGRRLVGGRHVGFGDVELWLVGDIAHHAGFRACAEYRALRTLEDFDALQVRGVDVEVAARQRAGLVVEVDRDAREAADAA